MKRILKFFFNLVLALAAVGITFVIVFLITPAWQKGVLEKGFARDSGRQWKMETVRIRPTSLEVGGLQVLEGMVGVEVDKAILSGPFWKSPITNVLQIDEGQIHGLYVDLKSLDVGDLSPREWKTFSNQVGEDQALWTERINLVLSKLDASGWTIHVNDLEVDGLIILPDDVQIPVRWLVVEADSRDLSKTLVEPIRSTTGTEL